jgi:hypothetical protein
MAFSFDLTWKWLVGALHRHIRPRYAKPYEVTGFYLSNIIIMILD